MNNRDKIIDICNSFVSKKIDIEDFQSRLQTVLLNSDEKKLEHILNDADNKLEDIIFCSKENNFYKYGLDVVTFLKNNIEQ